MEAAITTVGGAILSASFQVLFDELGKQDLLKYARDGDVEDEVNKWKSKLETIYEVLEDAEEKQMVDGSVEKWFSELRDLAYDVEDIVDEFSTDQALRLRRLEDEPVPTPSNVRKFIPTCCATPNFNLSKFKFNSEMLKKTKGITRRLDDIIETKNRLGLSKGGRGKINQKWERNSMSCVLEEKETQIYGRDEDKKKILQLLKAEAASGVDVSVIAIVGMGGMGKTTLAQLLYNDDATLDFDFKAWASVGTEAFDVRGVTQSILQSLQPNANIENKNLNWLQTELKKELHQKKCLIVLDDVWYEVQFYSHWMQFRGPLLGWAPESRIVVTTRHERVSSMMGAMSCHSLEQLSQDDFLSVLAQHALGVNNFNGHPHLKETSNQIASRCKGLPLAAKTLGGLLRGIPHPKAWEDVLNSNIWDFGDSQCEILPALMLSYIHLPSHLKQCFAYFAVFPKDFEFDRNELVLLWMAEGFVNGKYGEMQDLGCKYFDELLSRSLLQQSSSNGSLYVMHDLIHDLAQSVSKGMCFHLGDKLEGNPSYTKFRHSSFFSDACNTWQNFGDLSKMQSLRTFLALPIMEEHGFERLSSKVLHEIVPKLRFLRVLSLSGYEIEELPSSIGGLKHLRYLNLSGSHIKRLPEELVELFNLQILRLRGCRQLIELPSWIGNLISLYSLDISHCEKLTKLPQGISNLINLHLLDMSHCSKLTELPDDISKLINLSCLNMSYCRQLNKLPAQIGKLTLSDFIVGKKSGVKLTELKGLSKLQGKLRIRGLQNVVDIGEADFADLKEKGGIEELELHWADYFSVSRNKRSSIEVGVLNSLRPPHQKLSSLSIDSFGGTELPSWLGDPIFSKLVKLQLRYCRNITSLPPLGQLPSLVELSVEGMNGVKEVGAELYGDGSSSFASLEALRIEDMEEWEQWNWSSKGKNGETAVRFSKLRDLKVNNCPKLVGKLPVCIPSLQKLWIGGCQQALLKSMSDFSCLTTLEIRDISGLESLDEVHIEDLEALQDLRVSRCKELIYLWKDGANLDKFASLKSLAIDRCHEMVCLEGQLPCNLQDLNIEKCGKLRYLWKDGANLDKLASLKMLDVSLCGQLVSLVDGKEGKLPCNLQVLKISHCMNLEKVANGLHGLTGLRKLKIYDCNKLKSFCLRGVPYSLRSLNIYWCQSLASVGEGFIWNQMSQLEKLKIRECSALTSSPNGQFPNSLIRIECYDWATQLFDSLSTTIASPNGFSNLTKLEIANCPQLERFPEIRSSSILISSLQSLKIDKCDHLSSLPSWMRNLTSLQSLEIICCGSLNSFPQGGLPTSLTRLSIIYCENLKQPMSEWGLRRLTSLTHFKICATATTEMFDSFPDKDGNLLPKSLTHLCISVLKNLKSISRGILCLTSLQCLWIIDCPKIRSLPEKCFLPSLGYLCIKNCPLLKTWCLNHEGDHRSIIFAIPSVDFSGLGICTSIKDTQIPIFF